MEGYDFYTRPLAACATERERRSATFTPQVALNAQPLAQPAGRRQGHQPPVDLRPFRYTSTGVDLTSVPGIDVLLAQDMLAEVGRAMSPWRTDKHFAAWLGLAPNHKASAGKIKSRQSKPTHNRAHKAFRLAAQSGRRTQTALGAFCRRIKAKPGAPAAITATAHKLARIVYHRRKQRQPYHDPGAQHSNEQQHQRLLHKLQRQAKKLGLTLVPDAQPAVS